MAQRFGKGFARCLVAMMIVMLMVGMFPSEVLAITEKPTDGSNTAAAYMVTVVDAGIVFTTQPDALTTVASGDVVTLTIAATAGNDDTVSYQWYRCDDADKANQQIITGATSASYNPPTDAGGSFYYFCRATAGGRTADSNVATVHVTNNHTVTFNVVDDDGGILSATVDGVAITSGDVVEEGKNVVFIARPKAGFSIREWAVDGAPVPNYTSRTYTLTDLTASTIVTVAFKQELQSIILTPTPTRIGAGDSVTITAAGNPTGGDISGLEWVFSTDIFTRDTTNAEDALTQTFTVKDDVGVGTYPVSAKLSKNNRTLHAPAIFVYVTEVDQTRYTANLLATKITVNRAKTQGAMVPFTTNATNWSEATPVKLYTDYGNAAKQKELTDTAQAYGTFAAAWIDAGTLEIGQAATKTSKSVKNVTVEIGGVPAGKLNITVNETYPKITLMLDKPLNAFFSTKTAELTAKSADGSAVTIQSVSAAKGTVAIASGTTITPIKKGTENLDITVVLDGYHKPNKNNTAIKYAVKVANTLPKLKLSTASVKAEVGKPFTLSLLPSDKKFPTLEAYLDSLGTEIESVTTGSTGLTVSGTENLTFSAETKGKKSLDVKLLDGKTVQVPLTVSSVLTTPLKGVTLKTTAKTATIHKNFTGKIIDLPLVSSAATVVLDASNMQVTLPETLKDKVDVTISEGNVELIAQNGNFGVGTHKFTIEPIGSLLYDAKTKTGIKPITYSIKVANKTEGSASVSLKGKLDIANPESFITATVKLTNTAGVLKAGGVTLTGIGSDDYEVYDIAGNKFKIRVNPNSENLIVPGLARKLNVAVTLANNEKPAIPKQITITPSQTKSKATQSVKEIVLYEAMQNKAEPVTLNLTTPANVKLGAVKMAGGKAATATKSAMTANQVLGFSSGGFEVFQTGQNGLNEWRIGFHNDELPIPAKGNLKASYTVKLELWAEGTYRLDANNEPIALVDGKKKSTPTIVSVKVIIVKKSAWYD